MTNRVSILLLNALLFIGVNLISFVTCTSDAILDKWLLKGKCKGIWRPENMVGRCLGLVQMKDLANHYKIPELSHIKSINSSVDCRSLCCNLDDCVTWQYESTQKECVVGPKVRLGLESAGTALWCEPLPPAKWNGQSIAERNKDGTCTWSSQDRSTQCFGLGAERLNSTDGRLNTQECQQNCCKDPDCGTWQEMPGRGCYYGKGVKPNCDLHGNAVYEGGRKCIPGHCSGLESKLLPNYNNNALKSEK